MGLFYTTPEPTRGHIFGTTRPIFTKFLVHVIPMAVARSSSGGVVIRYVFFSVSCPNFHPNFFLDAAKDALFLTVSYFAIDLLSEFKKGERGN